MNEKKGIIILGEVSEISESPIKELLEESNLEVLECGDGIDAIRKSFAKKPDLIMLDVMLPRLNGYQCARIIKNDPIMNTTPIIHMGSSDSPIEQYWSRTSGADACLQKPIDKKKLDEIIHTFFRKRSDKRSLFAPCNIIPDLDDSSILKLAANLLERELLRANILNEISVMNISAMSMMDIVMDNMKIIDSLFDFTLGIALLIYDQNAEFFFYQNGHIEQKHLEEIKNFIFKNLENESDIYIKSENVKQTLLQSPYGMKDSQKTDDIYIHPKESGLVRVMMAFENIGFEKLRGDEQKILKLLLDLSHNVLERKILLQISQELSIIDAVTEGYSMAFFLTILKREIESANRNNYPLTLFTIVVSNFRDMTKNLDTRQIQDLIRTFQNLILKSMRKSDIVARWETASFAFLLPHIPLEKARIAQERICKYIQEKISGHLPPAAELKLAKGVRQFDPERDRTPEFFFVNAQPPNASDRNYIEDMIS